MESVLKLLNRKEVAELLTRLKPSILQKWETLCRQQVGAAKVQSRLALRDSVPEFIDRLIETLLNAKTKSEAEANSEVAREHAEDRASQPEYTLDQVIAEYHLLRVTITDELASHGFANEEARRVIHEFLDLGICKAVERYIEVSTSRQLGQTAEIQTARAEAERANEAKSAFLANMSHEIRSPVGAIMGFVGLLKDSLISKDEISKYLSIIERNSHQLLRIIDDILDLTKVDAGKMIVEKIDFPLADFLNEFSSLAEFKARENGIVFELNLDGELPEFVTTDPTRLRQILSNVVGNAIKFTEKGRVELLVSYRENRLELKVTDTGRGISDEQRGRLFHAFAQADSSTTRRFGGTGLGLILTKKLSEALGGHFILAKSEFGKGSVFEVSVPVTLPSFASRTAQRVLASIHPQEQNLVRADKLQDIEILLVEDSVDNQVLIERMLNKTGAKVTVVNNGVEGVSAALTKSFDVIIMDIQMPLMDGHEAMRTLRGKGYTGSVVALTAHAMKDERDRAIASGFTHFLTKPVNQTDLTELLVNLNKPLNLDL